MIIRFLNDKEMTDWIKKQKKDIDMFVDFDDNTIYTEGDAIRKRAELFKEKYENKPNKN